MIMLSQMLKPSGYQLKTSLNISRSRKTFAVSRPFQASFGRRLVTFNEKHGFFIQQHE